METEPTMTDTTINADEISKFAAMADEWWDPTGKFKPLHKFNPVRLGYIRDQAIAHFGKDGSVRRPLEGLKVLDIGCGGGLLSEPLARLGAQCRRHRRRRKEHPHRRASCRPVRPRDRLSRHHGGSAGGEQRALRHRAQHGSGRARR